MRRSIQLTVAAVAALVASPLAVTQSQAASVWDTGPVVVVREVSPIPRVTDLRVGEHANFDRIVIDLHGRVPGYRSRYVRELRYDGSGDHVPLRGRKFIQFVVNPSKAHNAAGESTYDGPVLKQYHLTTLRGVAFTGDFEGVVSFGLSLRSKKNFRVSELHSPNRLIIDVHH